MTATDRRILLFGKIPAPGVAKTRLAPSLGFEGAAELYRAFLEDTAATVRSVPGVRAELWLEPWAAEPCAGTVSGSAARASSTAERLGRRLGLPVFRQEGEELGARLRAAFRHSFEGGARRVVVVGSDHPTLPGSRLEEALEALGEADVVLGPSEDGGYYAVGVRDSAWPRAAGIFRDVPWSTPEVLHTTRRTLRGLGLVTRELVRWYDVDGPADLERLVADLRPRSRTAAALARLRPAAPSRRPGVAGRPPGA